MIKTSLFIANTGQIFSAAEVFVTVFQAEYSAVEAAGFSYLPNLYMNTLG